MIDAIDTFELNFESIRESFLTFVTAKKQAWFCPICSPNFIRLQSKRSSGIITFPMPSCSGISAERNEYQNEVLSF